MYRPACCRRPLLLLYLGVAGLASAQELPPLNPASEGLTPERIAEIRRIFQVESETTSSDQSIRIVGDCISYPDKSTLLSFTEDVRAALDGIDIDHPSGVVADVIRHPSAVLSAIPLMLRCIV